MRRRRDILRRSAANALLMRRSIPITLAALALVAVAVAPVSAAKPTAEAKAKAEHARIVDYWTPQRMKNAIGWCVVSGTGWTDLDAARANGAILVEQLS